jgi:putative membrane protein
MHGYYYNGPMMHGFYGGAYHGWAMFFGWLIFIILLTILIVVITRYLNKSTKSGTGTERSALDILNERYARGEIGTEEFREKKKEIQQ